METIADVLAYISARARVVPAGQWIQTSQVFITRLKESRYPTRAELDAAAQAAGLKIGDVDPRCDASACFEISDKALAIGGGVVEAVLSRAEHQWTNP